MNLLFDTHAFLWWDSSPEKLSKKTLSLCENPSNILFLSAVSAWEIKIKEGLGKLKINRSIEDLINDQVMTNGVQVLDISLPHIYKLDSLPHHHKDPFDRLLIGQALHEGFNIISKDTNFSKYPVKIIW